jgi:hypothetical protein
MPCRESLSMRVSEYEQKQRKLMYYTLIQQVELWHFESAG